MSDIFNRTTEYGGGMSADATKLTFAQGTNNTNAIAGFIVQQLQIQYGQEVSRLYALEDGKVYFVAGPTNGSMSVNHILGPKGLLTSFWETYGDVCAEGTAINLDFFTGCGSENSAVTGSIKITRPVLKSINITANAGNMQIASGLEMMFVSLETSSRG